MPIGDETQVILKEILEEVRKNKEMPCGEHSKFVQMIEDSRSRQDRLDNTLQDLSKAIVRLSEINVRLEKRLDEGDRKFSNLDSKIDDMQQGIHKLDKKLEGMENREQAVKDTTARNMSIAAMVFATIMSFAQMIIKMFHIKIGG